MSAKAEKKEAPAGDAPAKKGGKGKLVVIAVVALVVLGGGGAGAAWFMGMFGEPAAAGDAHAAEAAGEAKDEVAGHGAEPAKAEHVGADSHGKAETDAKPPAEDAGHGEATEGHGEATAPGGIVFVDMPDVLVNLQSDGKRMRFLKLRVALEVANQGVGDAVKALMPRVMDSFQLYLRALSLDDVKGAAGLQRLKEDMLRRINIAVEPERVDDVLFKEMLVQ